MFINDRARALDPEQSQPAEHQTPIRRQRTEESEAPGYVWEHSNLPARIKKTPR